MEIWKDIVNYEGLYQISNEGNVKSLDKTYNVGYGGIKHQKEKILKPTNVGRGYLHICLCKNGKKEYKRIHRLVAEAFIPNPNNYPTINHKDENPKNNKVENLEWCTQSYNNTYGGRTERMAKTQSKKVYQYTLDGELVKIWSSTNECGRNGFCQGWVAACCRGERKTHKGFKWSYTPF